ncbi:MAG: Rid family hydrolase [Gammaproteobacteria bacterium]
MKKGMAFVVLVLLGMSPLFAADVEYYRPDSYKERNLPFSRAVRVGDLLFLAGDLGAKDGKLVEGGIEAEARQTMENIKATLAHYKLGMDNLVKCTVYLADISEWGRFNEIYAPYFDKNMPARAALAVNGLALGARVEVECIAAFPD